MPAAPNTSRDAQIVAAARLGQLHEVIARRHGLSRARITQIVTAAAPREPGEAQRQLIADRLRSRWDEMEKTVRNPPIKTTSIGRTQWDPRTCTCGVKGDTARDHTDTCKVEPVLDEHAKIKAVDTQLKIEQQYRQMFGVDLAARPEADARTDMQASIAILAAAREAEIAEMNRLRAENAELRARLPRAIRGEIVA